MELLDIFPTLVDLAGIGKSVPKCINGYAEILCTDGLSLKPLIDNKAEMVRFSFYLIQTLD